jgi:oxygen-dependent protoporphyrinogen oxidase
VEKQQSLVLADLRKTLGVTGKPVFAHHAVYAQAIPQYEIGYGEIRRRIEALELKCPGLYLGGNYHKGVSLGDSLVNGLDLGIRIAEDVQDEMKAPPMHPELAAA